MKKLIYVFVLLDGLFFGCYFIAKYIPVPSPYYKIEEDKIIFESDYIKLTINSLLRRPDEYKQTTQLHILINAKKFKINYNLDSVKVNTYKANPNVVMIGLWENGDRKGKISEITEEKGKEIDLFYVTEDATLEQPNAYLKKIEFNFSNVFSIDTTKLRLPVFRFKYNK